MIEQYETNPATKEIIEHNRGEQIIHNREVGPLAARARDRGQI
jgi:hypothetical protein